ncbi:MAG: hypothetical protein IPH20_25050 [Bacteroidales bacterium]|nr:hypothetical protein [Bacteroidales bacterium]
MKSSWTAFFNLSAPQTTDNAGYTMALGKVLHRPVFFSIPAFGLRLVYGEGPQPSLPGQGYTGAPAE